MTPTPESLRAQVSALTARSAGRRLDDAPEVWLNAEFGPDTAPYRIEVTGAA